ncbi:Glutamate receptor 1 [Amphibalanus amphitrite]|uniref:Glutamate receptor 1 n=1 Tax=Amphibalanus amphitrite TaxID=1232801 RepID=A0A6A4W480_AMPAM|nr:Glutamate receptor 1 [Amphibalanus amphitrite]
MNAFLTQTYVHSASTKLYFAPLTSTPFLLFSVCDKVFSLGVHLMLGYVNPDAFDTLHSYANTFQMPFVAPWFPQKVRQMSTSLDYALSMRPEYHQAVLDIINHYRWDDVIYLYDSEDGECDVIYLFDL